MQLRLPKPFGTVGLLFTWALVVLGALSLWLLSPTLHAGRPLGERPAAQALAKIQELSRALQLPAESPLLPLIDGSASAPEAALPAGLLSFPAQSPLEAVARLQEHAGTASATTSDGAEEAAEAAPADSAPSCNDVHPNADSPNMLHVVFASDPSQVEGVQASVASVVASAAVPDELTVHIIVQRKWTAEFKKRFGLPTACQGIVTVTGVLIKVHAVDGKLIQRSVAKVPQAVRKERGAIDSVENFARFYMHLVLDRAVVIYLDADTIVQADLGQLRKQLIDSQKTVGFVARDKSVRMDKFLRRPSGCATRLKNIKKLMSMPAYNVGVFAVNLQRWREQRVVERVEELVAEHNRCGGKLWVGGSQPPLLLAFLDRPPNAPEDYVVFDPPWNSGDLGWRTNLRVESLKNKYVLHWNGNRKPWKENGLYKALWQPHRDRFATLLRPYDSGGDAHRDPEATTQAPEKTSGPAKSPATTTVSAEELAARAACPSVRMLDEWSEASAGAQPCVIGRTYGCRQGRDGMWTGGGCSGLFNVSGTITTCGLSAKECAPGELPKPPASCGLMVLTSFFTTKKDWQRGKFAKASFRKIQKLYQTAMAQGANVTVIYDNLPAELLAYSNPRFSFVQVNLTDFSKRYGLNDVRYFFFERLVKAHPEWSTVFIVDAFDVRIGRSPCLDLKRNQLHVGSEQDRLKRHPWMKVRFQKMGGKYQEWYTKSVITKQRILNCGITGGSRETMVQLLRRMREVLTDPKIAIMNKTEDINLNMAALNFVVYTEFATRLVTGQPVHSVYKKFERRRKDVWFIHK